MQSSQVSFVCFWTIHGGFVSHYTSCRFYRRDRCNSCMRESRRLSISSALSGGLRVLVEMVCHGGGELAEAERTSGSFKERGEWLFRHAQRFLGAA